MANNIKDIVMPKSEFMAEHKRLLKVLKTGKGREAEYKRQHKEVAEHGKDR